jgi:hypothetical protein
MILSLNNPTVNAINIKENKSDLEEKEFQFLKGCKN